MIEMNWLSRWEKYSPNAVALKDADTGIKYTFAECNLHAKSLAVFLQETYSIKPGDRIALVAKNEIETIFLFFACQYLGAILVPYNFRLTKNELDYLVRDTKPEVLYYQPEFFENVEELPITNIKEFSEIKNHLDQGKIPVEMPFLSAWEKPCMILYTSGTTGRPKGAMITPKMLFWNSINTALRLDITQADCCICFLPLFHTGGWNVLTTPLLHHGGKTVFMRKFDPDSVLKACETEKASILFGVPTTMDMMARSKSFQKLSLKSVKYAIVGGEAMPIPLIEKWQAKGIPIRQGYGLTEFGPNVFSLNESDVIRKIGSIGFPNFYVNVKVVDDEGNECLPGETGELLLKGPTCMARYWQNGEATCKAIQDGWLRTGDLVKFDTEGYFYVVDRKKDMFISGGENVYPLEVEHHIRKHPAIREVAIIGVPDEKWGEVGKAFVVPENSSLSAEEIVKFCHGHLAKFKIPKYVEFLAELPKGDSGKVLKKELRHLVAPEKSKTVVADNVEGFAANRSDKGKTIQFGLNSTDQISN